MDNESVSTPVDREQRKRGEKRERETEKGKEGKEGKEISRVNFHRAKGRKGGDVVKEAANLCHDGQAKQ